MCPSIDKVVISVLEFAADLDRVLINFEVFSPLRNKFNEGVCRLNVLFLVLVLDVNFVQLLLDHFDNIAEKEVFVSEDEVVQCA